MEIKGIIENCPWRMSTHILLLKHNDSPISYHCKVLRPMYIQSPKMIDYGDCCEDNCAIQYFINNLK